MHKIEELDGIGRRMPLTTLAFSLAACGMIGLPPTAGWISKRYLEQGAEAAQLPWVGWVLLASSLLNAAYFLPLVYRAWFRRPPAHWPSEQIPARGRLETGWLLLLPPLVTAAATLTAGIFADSGWSPLFWARLSYNFV